MKGESGRIGKPGQKGIKGAMVVMILYYTILNAYLGIFWKTRA